MLISKLNAIREEKDAEDRGFTLIELLVVVVIIGILIAIAIPLYLNYQKGAHDKSAASDLRSAVSALEQCYSENSNSYPAGFADQSTAQTLNCPDSSTTETINMSDGTHMTYVPVCASGTCTSYTITAWNTGGHKNAFGSGYSYVSSNGGKIG